MTTSAATASLLQTDREGRLGQPGTFLRGRGPLRSARRFVADRAPPTVVAVAEGLLGLGIFLWSTTRFTVESDDIDDDTQRWG